MKAPSLTRYVIFPWVSGYNEGLLDEGILDGFRPATLTSSSRDMHNKCNPASIARNNYQVYLVTIIIYIYISQLLKTDS